MTTPPAPTLRGWTPMRVIRDGDVWVYVYTRDVSATPQRPTTAKFGAGLVGEGYSDQGRTLSVRVQE